MWQVAIIWWRTRCHVHPGIKATRKLIKCKFVWHRVNAQVNSWSLACVKCQLSKVHRHVHAPLGEYKVPTRCFEHIHVDIVGPLLVSRGYTYVFTIIDRFTLWPEAIPISDISTMTCSRALISSWIARLGVPARMTSDRGAHFTSELWSSMAQLFGTWLHHSTAYHPQDNGIVERFHRQMKGHSAPD